ncbi:MAG TPA: PIG-L family deacetylase [Fimbriimonadaceae bacterium]|nr:PIG-L family deacetylase [Fimbriimonadaceae bacterium]
MKAFDFNPNLRWLFCMTHPDDEISVAGLLHRLMGLGIEIHLSWTHSTPVREAEARAVFSMLPPERLTFFGAPDGEIVEAIPDLLPRFVELITRVQPDRIACGAFEQGHLDHDATNLLVNLGSLEVGNLGTSAASPSPPTPQIPIFEAPFYHTYLTKLPRVGRFADPSDQEILELTSEEVEFKVKVARSYPSQRIWSNLIWANLRALVTGDGSLSKTERLRLQTHRDFLTPNLPAPLRNRVQASAKWERWTRVLRNSGILEP